MRFAGADAEGRRNARVTAAGAKQAALEKTAAANRKASDTVAAIGQLLSPSWILMHMKNGYGKKGQEYLLEDTEPLSGDKVKYHSV